MTEDNPSFILTHSQELQLLSDQDVGSMMHLFNEETQAVDEYYNYQELVEEKLFNTIVPSETIIAPPPEIPVAPSIISNEDYSGPYDFEISIKQQPGNSSWVGTSKNMYVRATPLYSSPQHAQELVKRCLPHSSPLDSSNLSISSELFVHVLRCQHPNAYYYGNVDSKMFLNVIVPLGQPQAGTDIVRVMYSFVCNNSCPSGMNRKALEVVYTLEDEGGNVFGRKKVSVRVCSCPKRDKEKEEKDSAKEPSKGKRVIRTEKKPYSYSSSSLDTKEYNLNINICGKNNRSRLARMAYEIITTQVAEHGPIPQLKANQEQLLAYLKSLD